MPVLISTELNNIDRFDTGLEERPVIIVADAFKRIHKHLAVSHLLRRLPDNISEPGRTQIGSSKTQNLVTQHVQKGHRPHPLELSLLRHLGPVAPTAAP